MHPGVQDRLRCTRAGTGLPLCVCEVAWRFTECHEGPIQGPRPIGAIRVTGIGRHAQAKNTPGAPTTQCRWPTKSVKFLLHLLKNAESNAEVRGRSLPGNAPAPSHQGAAFFRQTGLARPLPVWANAAGGGRRWRPV